jgi:hypothetical protein
MWRGISMSCRTVPEKVSEFPVRCVGQKYGDTCIQERMRLKWRQQVQLITATLAMTPWFERETGSCCVGKETKQVIYASNAPQVPMGNRSMAIMPQPVRPVQDQNGS